MCGRFVQAITADELSESLSSLGYALLLEANEQLWLPSYNVTPSQSALVLTHSAHGLTAQSMNWGFPPFTPKGQTRAISPINARGDRLLTSPMFSSALGARRCVVPVNGYYEWKTSGSKKQPYYLTRPSELLFLAGLYTPAKGTEVKPRFAIVTTNAHHDIAFIHDREPVVLDGDTAPMWIEGTKDMVTTRLNQILAPALLDFHEVSTAVNSPAHNDPSLIEPISLFG
ncbi:MAG: SOS response-associated peptidase [Acidimicrobiales bacterium]